MTIQLKRASQSTWEKLNPVLAYGEPGYEKETGKLKIGDGVTAWNDLSDIAKESIPYIDGSNIIPPLVLMDLEPGSYVLNGTFAYSNNPENGQFPFINTLVQINEVDEGQKSISFQVSDEIICIFFTYDSYEFKRYNLNDIGGSMVTVTVNQDGMASLNAYEIYQKVYLDGVGVQLDYNGMIYNISASSDGFAHFTSINDDSTAECIIISDDGTVDSVPQSYVSFKHFEQTLGDVETALDRIVAIQESLIGGATE